MADTMTLEDVRDLLASYGNAFMDVVHAVDAALRERDELIMRRITWMEEAQTLRARAEKAEAELAATIPVPFRVS